MTFTKLYNIIAFEFKSIKQLRGRTTRGCGKRKNMKKLAKFLTVAIACVLCANIAACTKETKTYDPYINNPDYVGDDTTSSSNKYVVNVTSAGSLPLSDVKISLKKSDGSLVKTGISKDGKIEFNVALGEYTLEIDEDSLPDGYYLDGTVYKTNPEARDEVNVKIPSKVISQTATSTTSYAVGDIIRDFVFTDCYGTTYKLSETLEEKKVVVLNFWYTGCAPCKSEFPAIQKSYSNYSDVAEFFGMCYTGYGDTNKAVSSYKDSNNLSLLKLGTDSNNLGNNFGVTAYPTTVVIDRYGLIAYRSTGSEPAESFWNALFANYTSDNYSQNPSADDGGNDDGTEQAKPDVTMPESSAIESALNDDSVKATYYADPSEYSWPFLVGSDGSPYVYASNENVDNSYSMLIADVPMKTGQLLSFEYNINTESGADILYVIIDDESIIPDGLSGNSDGWQTYNLYVADRDKTINLIFAYIKDSADPDADGEETEDIVRLRNLRLSDASKTEESIDIVRPAASGITGESATHYDYYASVVYNESDGFYHVGKADGPLLYMTIDQLTPWSDLHTDGNTTTSGSLTYYNTLYYITYYEYSNRLEGDAFAVNIAGKDITKELIQYKSVSNYIDMPNNLMPVSKELQAWAELFCTTKASEQGRATYDQEWLEFCYYYDHYGNEHDDCLVYEDRSKGLSMYNSYTAQLDTYDTDTETYNASTGLNRVYIDYMTNEASRGDYYAFTAPYTGVYSIRSSYIKDTTGMTEDEIALTKDVTPYLFLYDEDLNILNSPGEEVRDFDQFFTDEEGNYLVTYEGYNDYIALEAGETVYLRVAVYFNTLGMYDFRVHYEGETFEKLYTTATAAGAETYYEETGQFYFLAMDVVYNSADDCYYIKKANGEPDLTEPIYIDMIHGSYFVSSFEDTAGNYHSLQWLMSRGAFTGTALGKMNGYLGEALDKDPDDPYYGMVLANAEIVLLLQDFIAQYSELPYHEGNGWLAFGVYNEHFGIGL